MSWFLPQSLIFRIFLLLVPLVVYDITTSRRVHRQTWVGALMILVGHVSAVGFGLGGGEGWRLWLQGVITGFR
jgi:hypothetical protein